MYDLLVNRNWHISLAFFILAVGIYFLLGFYNAKIDKRVVQIDLRTSELKQEILKTEQSFFD